MLQMYIFFSDFTRKMYIFSIDFCSVVRRMKKILYLCGIKTEDYGRE